MKKENRILFLLCICLALALLPLTCAQTRIQIPKKESFDMDPGTAEYFIVDISGLLSETWTHIGISSIFMFDKCPLKVFVSLSDKNPSELSNDYSSTSSSGNTIIIPRQDIEGKTKMHVGVICVQAGCQSTLNFDLIKELTISADGEKRIETVGSLEGATAAILRVDVPKNNQAERIVFHLDAIPNKEDELPELVVYINQGREIPSTNKAYTISRAASWFEGRSIVIDRSMNMFCTGCEYTLSLQFNQFSSISMEVHVFESLTDLGGSFLFDGVKKDRSNFYHFQIPKENIDEDLLIQVVPHEGVVRVYLNCDTQPHNLQSYYYRYQNYPSSDILMTAREHSKCRTNTYYLAVYGEASTVYGIRAISKKASKLLIRGDDQTMGEIFPGEKITYEIFMPTFIAEKIVIQLEAKSELGVEIMNCRFPTDCPGLLPGDRELRFKDMSGIAGNYDWGWFEYQHEMTDGVIKYEIDPHDGGSYPILIEDSTYMEDSSMAVYAYKLTLISHQESPVKYTLNADSEGHQWLFPGISTKSRIRSGEMKYFVAHVPQDDITFVKFQLTEYSGDVEIYISKCEKYPNKENDIIKFAHEGLIIFADASQDVSGTYYIGVYGKTASSFAISSTFITENGKTESQTLHLEEGAPQKGVLLPKHYHPAAFYKFKINLAEGWQGSIKISTHALRGNALVTVTNGGMMPLPNNYFWKSNGGLLEISSDDENFRWEDTYYIGVFTDWTIIQVDDIVYTISYSIKGSLAREDSQDPVRQLLSPLTPFYSSLKKGEVEYFEALIHSGDDKITLYKHTDVGDVDIFLSLTNEDYLSFEKHDMTTRYTFKDYLELNAEDIAKACPRKQSFCSFYFSVVPTDFQEETSYSLTMKRDYKQSEPTLIPLADGRQQQMGVPQENEPANFYFYAVLGRPSVITVTAPGQNVAIFARRETFEIGSVRKFDLKIPKPESAEFSSNSSSLIVGLNDLNIPRFATTIITTVAVYFNAVDTENAKSQFLISVSSDLTQIYSGLPEIGVVEQNRYMYFYFNVLKPFSTLLISMTSLDGGDADLVVSKARESVPNIENHQFASISQQRTEVLEINNLNISPDKTIKGTWMIGVYGKTKSNFTLTVIYEDPEIVVLPPELPFESSLSQNSTIYFQFENQGASGVEIKVDKFSGDLTGYVVSISEELDSKSNLPTADNAAWSMKPDPKAVLNIDPSDPRNCEYCCIMVALHASTASKFSITISKGSKYPRGGTLAGDKKSWEFEAFL